MPYLGRSANFGVRTVFHYLASNGDTSVSGADADGKTLTFADGNYIDVYLNGVRLKSGEDYNTNTANTVAGMSSLNANDEVNVIVYDAFSIADVLPLDGGNLTGNLTLKSDSAVLSFGADSDINITHVADTGLTTNGDFTVGDDLILNSDSSVIKFGTDSEITLTHSADAGLLLKHAASGDDKFPTLTLQTGDTDIAADDVLGQINFQAPDEGTGTDAILVASTIKAFSEGDFSSSSNATTLELSTGSSAASGSDGGRLRLTSAGVLELKTQNTADGSKPVFHIQAGDDTIQSGDSIGVISFSAPNDTRGSDANLIAAQIEAAADANFSSTSNATALIFKTGKTAAAGERMRIDSDGKIGIGINDVAMDVGGIHLGDDRGVGFGDGNATRADFQLVYQSANTRLGLICGTGANTEDVIFTTSGKQHIGTTNSTARLTLGFSHSTGEEGIRITPDATTATMIRFDNSGGTAVGSITSAGGSTAFNTSSDYRLKENVSYSWDATSRLKQLKPARFNWIADDTNTLLDGFIAHEVSGIVPESITGDKDATQDIGTVKNSKGEVIQENVPKSVVEEQNGETWTKTGTENVYQSIDQSKLVPLLVKTIQELEARVAALESA